MKTNQQILALMEMVLDASNTNPYSQMQTN
jgi:hypothetical protein